MFREKKDKRVILILIALIPLVLFPLSYVSTSSVSSFMITVGSRTLDTIANFKNSSNIIISGSSNDIYARFNGSAGGLTCSQVVCRIVLPNSTQLQGNITLLNQTSVGLTRSGNRINFSGSGFSQITVWRSDEIAAVTNQGLNLPSALTNFANGDSKFMVLDRDWNFTQGYYVQCGGRGRQITAVSLTINVTIFETNNNPDTLICSFNLSFTASAVNTAVSQWMVKSLEDTFKGGGGGTIHQVEIFTSGGNGSADFVFYDIWIRFKPK